MEKVDFSEDTITIDGEVKNQWRKRRISLPDLVYEILKETQEKKDSSSCDERVVLHSSETFDAYSRLVKRALKKWRPDLHFAPKDFRNTIQTEEIERGWNDYLLRRYVGHAARSVGERHYFGDQGKRLINLFREQIVSCIDEVITEEKKGTKRHKPKTIEIV